MKATQILLCVFVVNVAFVVYCLFCFSASVARSEYAKNNSDSDNTTKLMLY